MCKKGENILNWNESAQTVDFYENHIIKKIKKIVFWYSMNFSPNYAYSRAGVWIEYTSLYSIEMYFTDQYRLNQSNWLIDFQVLTSFLMFCERVCIFSYSVPFIWADRAVWIRVILTLNLNFQQSGRRVEYMDLKKCCSWDIFSKIILFWVEFKRGL